MTDKSLPWRQIAEGVELRIRLTPKAARDEILGLEQTADGPAIKARVRALPADGAANAAIEKLVAKWIGVPKTSVAVSQGQKSRVKGLTIHGEPKGLATRLESLWQDLAAQ
ncbi:conserved protein of unknown function [Candidatus Filomicrobium marinum]|uniref:UPF0235 protein YBN1229_v1_0827 n=2 Tax=Filomicrobium TaxID=119044 RepID=A0A0D6JBP5_9HYPH|nr:MULTISPECIES: DUF167 family protein [Filomicrobium]MCV0370679.1 DUF167 family protein [Filomicrobium sp.]CFX06723.1 conserved protein of unknown function [Candidatus Filomicrobium marinum]CPR16480.1 conserved protein of unknown function [Candidatus Filomicrobium marinum]SDP57186.1 hypothetical protein SAMN04488061_3361 [Filomicrobium insigne]